MSRCDQALGSDTDAKCSPSELARSLFMTGG